MAVYAKSVPKLKENAMQKAGQTKEKCSMQKVCQKQEIFRCKKHTKTKRDDYAKSRPKSKGRVM